MSFNVQNTRNLLHDFRFHDLFLEEMGWNQPSSNEVETLEFSGTTFHHLCIAEMAGAAVFEVTSVDGRIPREDDRAKIYKAISDKFSEKLLIFVNADRTRSLWYWVKKEGSKLYPRIETYIKGQLGDLLLSTISGLEIEPYVLEEGGLPVVEVNKRLQGRCDFDRITKQFLQGFQLAYQEFLNRIQGIGNENDHYWYTSVVLNRLIFIYFLQKKGFIDNDHHYLRKKLEESQRHGSDRFFNEFLHTLFFEGLAKPERDRTPQVQQLLGKVCYLNGGLFLKHSIELKGYAINIPDKAFEQIFDLFDRYCWVLDDGSIPGRNEITPDVFGYIVESYVNQKAFGAYYTLPEITEYLSDRTINKLILNRVNRIMTKRVQGSEQAQVFESLDDMVMHMNDEVCRHLLTGENAILPNLSVLDPACGSGAFLIAALKTLTRIYEQVVAVIQLSTDDELKNWLDQVTQVYPSLPYFIRRRIITDNLYGVDIMEVATEITKLRLFLAIASWARTVDELEPLPNIDFNIMAGNSLIGLIRVVEESFNTVVDSEGQQGNLMQLNTSNSYRMILEEKNRSIEIYQKHLFQQEVLEESNRADCLQMLRNHINQINRESEEKLNQLLLNEFQRLGIFFEQAQREGNAKKRSLTIRDVETLRPFHWGYHVDKIIEAQGGFDVVITNPPWENFKLDKKEFFSQYDELSVQSDGKQRQEALKKLLQNPEIADAWLEYQSQYPHVSAYFRSAKQYKNQSLIVNGRKITTNINLYKLFLEQCFNLLKPEGECGIAIPSGIRNDFTTTQLRKMLLEKTVIDTVLTFSNEQLFFRGLHSSFKICLLTFEKGPSTSLFKHALYDKKTYDETTDLRDLLMYEQPLTISEQEIRLFSPNELSFTEFRNNFDIQILRKIMDEINFVDTNSDFHSTKDSNLFRTRPLDNDLPLYSGKNIDQFTIKDDEITFWINEQQGRDHLLLSARPENKNQKLEYQNYRLVYRSISSTASRRTLISAVLPPNSFCENSLNVLSLANQGSRHNLFVCAVLNSFCFDYTIRLKISGSHIPMSLIEQIPLPPTNLGSLAYQGIVYRAAKLICTTPGFDDLAAEVGLGSHANGVTDAAQRAQLRAELDGMVAHLYGLTEVELTHILSTFPIVPDETKQAALESYRNKVGDAEILNLIAQGESAQLEFKSTARWDLKENKKNPVMEEVILKTVTAFLNSDGGILLIGVDDDGNIIGLQNDYQTLKKKDRDGFELWLMGDLLLKSLGNDLAPQISVSFGIIETKEVCNVTVQPSPRPSFCEIKNKNGQSEECFFIRAGNQTKHLTKPSEIINYTQTRWSSPHREG